MRMLEDCINKIFEKANLTHYEQDKELYKSIYYHLCDYGYCPQKRKEF